MEHTPQLMLRILISLGLFNFVANQVCEDGGYVVINEPRRSTQAVYDDTVDTPLCDSAINEGSWFRFNSYAGDAVVERAANNPVPTLHCGTEAPIYIRGLGSHPVTDNTTETATVCANFAGNSCNWNATIQIHRCPGYYLYKLKHPPGCPLSYCAGEKDLCNLGDNWNGFECVNYFPPMKGRPIFYGPHVSGSGLSEEIYFSCEVQYDRQPNDSYARFSVTFLFDGQTLEDVPDYTYHAPEHLGSAIITSDSGLVVNLIELYLRGRLGREISCMVESFWDGSSAVSSPMTSVAKYRVAFESTVNSYSVNLTSGSTFNVTFQSTVPFTCSHCSDPTCCKYMFRVERNVSTTACVLNWTSSYTVAMTVYFVPHATQEGNSFALGFNPYNDDQTTADGRSLWRDYVIQTVTMTIPKSSGPYKACTSTGDPHITTFDGAYFDNYLVGDLYLVKAINAKQQMEIQVRQEVCNGGAVTCNCGIVVREGNSAFKISICEAGSWSWTHQRIPTVARLLAQDPADSSAIYMDGTGLIYSVRMYSGLRVEIDLRKPWFSVTVYLPPVYQGKTDSVSLCGNSNGNRNDDFRTNLNQFRIPDAKSYFRVQPSCSPIFNVAATQCGCNSTLVAKCSNTDPALSYISTNNKYSGKSASRVVCSKTNKRRRRETTSQDDSSNSENDFILDDDILYPPYNTYDPNFGVNVSFTWPTPTGKTEADVEKYCSDMLQSSPAYADCSTNADLQTIIAMCASDVQIADDWISVSAYTTVFEQSCLNNIATSITDSSDSAHVVLKSVSGTLCPNQCSGLGTCSEGTCTCNTGYIGADCSIDKSLPPSLTGIIRGGVCDVRARPCDVISVFGSGVAFSSALKCRFTDQTTGNYVETNGTFITAVEYVCPVPETTTHRRRRSVTTRTSALSTRKVSIAVNAPLYSNTLDFVMFDSVCMECNSSDACTQKDSSCLIGGECFSNGAVDPDDSCLQCIPGVSRNSLTNVTVVENWSPCSGDTCDNGVRTRNVACGPTIKKEAEFCQVLDCTTTVTLGSSVLKFSSLSYLLLTLALATSLMSVVVYWQWST